MKRRLLHYLREHSEGGVALAYSGGVDSTLLLEALRRASEEAKFKWAAFYFATPLQSAREEEEAVLEAAKSDAEVHVIRLNPLQSVPTMQKNPPERCLLCKRFLFTELAHRANEFGLKVLMDGTNSDDLQSFRPGLRALQELGVLSPLAAVGMGKQDVRELAAEWNLRAARKPSVPCLATRFEYGAELTEQKLARVAAGEERLREMFPGVGLRLRVHGEGMARIEVERDILVHAVERADEIARTLRSLGFCYVTLDLEALRSGSMDSALFSQKTENNGHDT